YDQTCNALTAVTLTFDHQVEIDGAGFSAPGDSGSLILTASDMCPRPVALLFAGSQDETMTFGNPIDKVLADLNVTMVGTCTSPMVLGPTFEAAPVAAASPAAMIAALAVKNRHAAQLIEMPGVTGVGVSTDAKVPAIDILVTEAKPDLAAAIPSTIEGIPTRVRV